MELILKCVIYDLGGHPIQDKALRFILLFLYSIFSFEPYLHFFSLCDRLSQWAWLIGRQNPSKGPKTMAAKCT